MAPPADATHLTPHPVVGLGCFLGPVAFNYLFAPQPSSLRWGVAASYCLFFAGFLLMLLAPSIWLLLASTFVRSMGAARRAAQGRPVVAAAQRARALLCASRLPRPLLTRPNLQAPRCFGCLARC